MIAVSHQSHSSRRIAKANPDRRLARGGRRGPLPVGAAVFGAVAAMGLWQLRIAAQEVAFAAPSPTAVESAVKPPDASTRGSAAPADSADKVRRLREGARLTNCVGHFRQSGDAVAFIDEQGRDIGGLPNLNLERVVRMLKGVDEPESVWWSISGTITEFSGRNYVIITRAVYKASSPPPAPDRLEQ